MLIYDVVRDPKLKLSDLADISRMSEILGFEVRDRLLTDLEDDDDLTLVEVGLKYGYPFYTLSHKAYVSLTSQWEKEVDDLASEIEEMPLECIEAFLKERLGIRFDINSVVRVAMEAISKAVIVVITEVSLIDAAVALRLNRFVNESLL